MREDYQKLGLKSGIEIHQQLDTAKLFCSCPSLVRSDQPDGVIQRKLRPVTGETGEIDIAAAKEKKKTYLYEYYRDTTCLVELDEEPPHAMNREALATVIQVARMVHATPVDQVQVMRKTIVDGSNTSGFQRTALVAFDGYIELKNEKGEKGKPKKISIPSISIEEDAAKIIEQRDDTVRYNLSRLGIPLIEIGTGPDLSSPEEVKEAAAQLGMILRSTHKVKRGLGTIRQDLNISIKGGRRVEIKGAQDLRLIPKLVEYEVCRQESLLGISAKLQKNPRLKDTILNDAVLSDTIHDVSLFFEGTGCERIAKALEKKGSVLALVLPMFRGLLATEVQPGRRLGTELSDHAKTYAGVGGIYHSDELPNYGIEARDVIRIQKHLKLTENDSFVLVAAPESQARTALAAVLERARACPLGVPPEVRRANPDGTTSFLRPIPGAARMYPETDCVPIFSQGLAAAEEVELITDAIERLAKSHSLNKELATLVVKSGYQELYEMLVAEFPSSKPLLIAEALVTIPKEIRKRYNLDTPLEPAVLREILAELDAGRIPSGAVFELLVDYARDRKVDLSKYQVLTDTELGKVIDAIITKNPNAPLNALMGVVMAQYRGKADG
ncbi:Glu-tRNA(Gln) amidotransferase GatDE subunit E, partial [Candidatus Woesearchaeota archaeon CG_4_10_14_0_8_um_filter_47_5]